MISLQIWKYKVSQNTSQFWTGWHNKMLKSKADWLNGGEMADKIPSWASCLKQNTNRYMVNCSADWLTHVIGISFRRFGHKIVQDSYCFSLPYIIWPMVLVNRFIRMFNINNQWTVVISKWNLIVIRQRRGKNSSALFVRECTMYSEQCTLKGKLSLLDLM